MYLFLELLFDIHAYMAGLRVKRGESEKWQVVKNEKKKDAQEYKAGQTNLETKLSEKAGKKEEKRQLALALSRILLRASFSFFKKKLQGT